MIRIKYDINQEQTILKRMYFKQLCYVFQSPSPLTFRNSFHTHNQSTICDEEHYTAWRYPSNLFKLIEGPENGENQTNEKRPNTERRLRHGDLFCHLTDSFFNCSMP